MKKILLFLLLWAGAVCGQLPQDSIQSIAKNYFEKEYVQQTFKDPYSYELKKIWSEPMTKSSNLTTKIVQLESMLKAPAFTNKQKKEFAVTLEKRKSELEKLSETDKNTITAYAVYLDTYGANSLGNKVLGKYTMTVDTAGNILGDIIKLN